MFGLFKSSNKALSFTKKYYKALEKQVEGLQLISLTDLEIKTKHNEHEHTHYLDNAYSEYVRTTQNKEEVIERYILSALDLYYPKEEFSIEKIVPIIKDRRFVKEIKSLENSDQGQYVFEKYNEGLYIFYAQDLENSMSYLIQENLAEHNISRPDLRAMATNNLMTILPNIERHGDNGYFMLTAGGDYEASLILDQSIWTKEYFPVKGEIIIGIPSRDVLLITGSEEVENIARLKTTVEEINQTGDHLVSDKIFACRQGSFELFEA